MVAHGVFRCAGATVVIPRLPKTMNMQYEAGDDAPPFSDQNLTSLQRLRKRAELSSRPSPFRRQLSLRRSYLLRPETVALRRRFRPQPRPASRGSLSQPDILPLEVPGLVEVVAVAAQAVHPARLAAHVADAVVDDAHDRRLLTVPKKRRLSTFSRIISLASSS